MPKIVVEVRLGRRAAAICRNDHRGFSLREKFFEGTHLLGFDQGSGFG
jgi:hypothetical protein